MKSRTALLVGLVVAAIAWRLYNFHTNTAPNLELLTATGMAAAPLLNSRWAALTPLLLAIGTDALIGNSDILLFTWSAWALTGAAALLLRPLRGARLVLAGTGLGLVSSLWFFVWTNFGVWVLGDGTMYSRSWAGLAQCYSAAVPFYRTMLEGNALLVPIALTGVAALLAHRRAPQLAVG